jgi:hypothetical protein
MSKSKTKSDSTPQASGKWVLPGSEEVKKGKWNAHEDDLLRRAYNIANGSKNLLFQVLLTLYYGALYYVFVCYPFFRTLRLSTSIEQRTLLKKD